jgi:hypothetical protein
MGSFLGAEKVHKLTDQHELGTIKRAYRAQPRG